jgi:hypothetical protein
MDAIRRNPHYRQLRRSACERVAVALCCCMPCLSLALMRHTIRTQLGTTDGAESFRDDLFRACCLFRSTREEVHRWLHNPTWDYPVTHSQLSIDWGD